MQFSTTDTTLVFDTAGLDTAASTIIAAREQTLMPFLQTFFPELQSSSGHTNVDQLRQHWRERDAALPRDAYMPLAQALGFVDAVRQRTILHCWRSGMLSRRWPTYARACKKRTAPALLEVIQQTLMAALCSSEHRTAWIRILVEHQYCRNERSARHVAYELDRIPEYANNQARDLVLSWCHLGCIGLLKYADYPCLGELVLVQRYAENIAPHLLVMLRSDMIALYAAFHHPDVREAARAPYGRQVQAWDQSLMHQPAGAQGRLNTISNLASLLHLIPPLLSMLRGCTQQEAQSLIDAFLQRGLPGLIDLRQQQADSTLSAVLERQQLLALTDHMLQAINTPARNQILIRLTHLHEALVETASGFPLAQLIRQLPSTRYRKHRQRQTIPEAFLATFAQRDAIGRDTAYAYVKNLMVYGPLGLLPQRDWSQAIHPRIWSYLWMFKFGRIDGTIETSSLVSQVNAYTQMLHITPLPQQIIVAVWNHFPKPRFYNSGDGEAIAGVPLRHALRIAGVERLHAQWLLLPVELPIDLINHSLHALHTQCWVTLVIDYGCQRPVGFWLSETAPTHVEVGLALYDAIFHTGSLHWPLRGIPEAILLPHQLIDHDDHLTHAAAWLMAELKRITTPEKQLRALPFADALVKELQQRYTPARISGYRRAPKLQMTIHQAEQDIRTWLFERCFPNHRTDLVVARLRKQGVALPGYDTPAAGWLLPVVAEHVTTVRGGIEFQERRYIDGDSGIQPGLPARIRSLPTRTGQNLFLFVELNEEAEPCLLYVPFESRHI